jgi:gliding motility-associated-like protein
MPHFGSSCSTFFTTQQILLYESLNVIDVNLIDKPACVDWNDGLAAVGLMGNNLSQYSVPLTRNTGFWEASNETWRFVPDGAPSTSFSFEWQDAAGTVIGTDLAITVCPQVETTYTAVSIFVTPGGTTEILTDDVVVTPSNNAGFTADLGDDQVVCDVTSVALTVALEGISPANATFAWNTGEDTQTINVTTSGDYTVEISGDGCTVVETVTVIFLTSPCTIEPTCADIDFEETFGTGTGTSCNLNGATTTYTCYSGGQMEDGEYSVSNTSTGFNSGWHQGMTDHTEGDTNGRMFVVNADIPVGEFYRRTIALNQNIDYTFSAWITTLYDTDTFICQGNSVPSNVRFRIEDLAGNTIEETVTGDLANGPDPNWQEFFINFNTGANTAIQLVLINNAAGGCGNDLAIDDISLSYLNGQPQIVTPADLSTCDTSGTGQGQFDLTSVLPEVLDGQDPAQFGITFHLSQLEAEVNLNAIAIPTVYTNTSNPEQVYVRVERVAEPTCFSTVNFNLVVNPAVAFDIDIPSVVSVCAGEGFPELDATPQNPNIDLNFVSYQWVDAQSNVVSTDAIYTPTAPGIYAVTVALEPCDATTVGFNAVQFSQPNIDLGADTCLGPEAILDATPSNYDPEDVTFAWLLNGETIAGETAATLIPSAQGIYTALVSVGGCVTEASVGVGPELDLVIDADFKTCPEEVQTITAATSAGVGSFQWALNGDLIVGANSSTLEVALPGGTIGDQTYTVTLTEGNCSNSASVVVSLYDLDQCVIPQGISPNDDGLNDCFDLEYVADRAGSFSVDIYNRYGMLVFTQNDYVNEFCGVDTDGADLVTGTYYYVIKFASSDSIYGELLTGWVYLNR